MTRFFLLLCFFFIKALYGDVEDHLRKIPDKIPGNHQMRNIDFIYLINLDERPEKFRRCIEELAPYQIYPYRFSAVNGWEMPLEVINDIGVKYNTFMQSGQLGTCYLPDGGGFIHHEIVQIPGRTYFWHGMPLGPIGCVLSHLSVLQDAYDCGYQTIWVMEDDIQVVRNPHTLSDYIEKLDALVGPNGWDILFTDRDTKDRNGNSVTCSTFAWRPNFTPSNPHRFAEKTDVSADFRKIGARYGAYSMIIRRSGMKKILDFIKEYQVYLPYDMDYTLPFGIRLFTVRKDVVSTIAGALSDNEIPGYKNPSL